MTELREPAFGEATIDDCEREQIHLPGSVQPFAALVVTDRAGEIVQRSANVGDVVDASVANAGRQARTCRE